jgi:hypothetical protein
MVETKMGTDSFNDRKKYEIKVLIADLKNLKVAKVVN